MPLYPRGNDQVNRMNIRVWPAPAMPAHAADRARTRDDD